MDYEGEGLVSIRVGLTRPQQVHLRDGATIRLRPAQPGDRAALRRMFFGLSDTTRYLYFCAGVPRDETRAEQVVRLGMADGHTSYALLAEANDEVIGVARFDGAKGGRTAEIGILLADGWQSRGLGRHVLLRLADEARRHTMEAFTGYILWENRRMYRLARRVFPGLSADCASGGCYLTMRLDGQPARK
ncbi:MAG TPA: GNAT family protein [Ktedonobacterales bacterium]|nr:GNAT family protein [Ktedonobacterales bacterium]